MDFIRARSEAQKDIRLNQIKDVAMKQFESLSYDKITIKSISSELDFTRSNLYKYFSTKEEIYATILVDEVAEWIQELKESIPNEPISIENVDAFCRFWATITYKHFRMIRLSARLMPLYAQNIPQDTLSSLIQALRGYYSDLKELINILFPQLAPEQVETFSRYQFSFLIGFYSMIDNISKEDVSNKMCHKISLPDFEKSFKEFLRILLVGIINR